MVKGRTGYIAFLVFLLPCRAQGGLQRDENETSTQGQPPTFLVLPERQFTDKPAR